MGHLTIVGGARSQAKAFERFIQPHFGQLYRRAYRFAMNRADAEDLVQEVCIRAFPRLSELEKMADPKPWLLCVLYRVFIDSTRRRDRSPIDGADPMDDDGPRAHTAGEELGPEQETERSLTRRRLEEAWRYLDPTQRVLLALHDVEGHTLAEIEELTGLPQGTIKSRLFRARVRLGRLLERNPPATQLAAVEEC
jgi:RNA polymerase sigma-70 factor (ECF subfamily)